MLLLPVNGSDNLTETNVIVSGNLTLPDDESVLYPTEWVIPVTVIYGIIFVTGIIGNVSTCVVISRNKSLHTVTNYYLFSIAISDLLLLISGLPPEMYRIWSPEKYVFGDAFCIIQGYAAETSANATVLAITAFTVERYLAICHPFLSHTMSNLSRAIKYIFAIWIVALCLAAPQAIQFGVEYEYKNGEEYSRCTVVTPDFFQHAFEISTFLIFVGPMTLITVLYILIALKLRNPRILNGAKRPSGGSQKERSSRASRAAAAQNRVIKMLVAVVVAFFICWAPFHAQRLLAVYLVSASEEAQAMSIRLYIALMYISGVLYFLSTTVNPLLYHIMSNKFRQAFKSTFYQMCRKNAPQESRNRTYSVLSRCNPSLRNYQRSVSDGVQGCQQVPLNQQPETNNGKDPASRTTSRNNFRPRMLSESSQTTVLTTISRTITDQPARTKRPPPRPHRNNRGKPPTYRNRFSRLMKIFNKPDGSYLKNCNVETTNTISNSSLQDLEHIEFSSSDLVRYMEEVNEDLS